MLPSTHNSTGHFRRARRLVSSPDQRVRLPERSMSLSIAPTIATTLLFNPPRPCDQPHCSRRVLRPSLVEHITDLTGAAGTSGTVKLAGPKTTETAPVAKKAPAAKKAATTTKAAATKKAPAKKAATKTTAAKKAPAAKKVTATKSKANTSKVRKTPVAVSRSTSPSHPLSHNNPVTGPCRRRQATSRSRQDQVRARHQDQATDRGRQEDCTGEEGCWPQSTSEEGDTEEGMSALLM